MMDEACVKAGGRPVDYAAVNLRIGLADGSVEEFVVLVNPEEVGDPPAE